MGTFFVEALIAAPRRPEAAQSLKLLVDTGSTYTWVSATVLRALGIEPSERRRIVTIEGRATERPAAEVLITLEGRTLHTICLFGESGDLEVLGAYTLEGFGLTVDPVQRRLIPALLYGAAAGVVRHGRAPNPVVLNGVTSPSTPLHRRHSTRRSQPCHPS
jgi:predicted aspartyl protease